MSTPAPLRRRPLGRTGLELTEIGFGAGPLGGFYGEVTSADAAAAVEAAWSAGIRYFDAAPLYGHGRAELRLGHVLREKPRDEYVLSTKVGRFFEPAPDGAGIKPGGLPFRPVQDYSRDGALRSLEQSLLRLGVSRVDIALIHDVDAHSQGSEEAAEAAFAEALRGAYPALVELKRAGAVRAIGIGLNQVAWARRWLREADLDCVMIAGRYTLLNREAAPALLPDCHRRGIGVLAAGAFNGGLLARGPGPEPRFNYRPAPADVLGRLDALTAAARSAGTDLKAAAIRFVLDHPAVTSLVTGAASAGEVTENVAALRADIPQAFWDEAERLAG